MTRLLIESEGVIISPDTPVIKHNPDPIDEYIVIVNLPEDWEEVHNYIINENNIKGIIVGNPVNMDGSASPSSQSAKDLALKLSKDVTKNITMWDERLSSEGAFNLSSNLDINVSKKVQKLDENAAQFILQGALDYLSKNNT